MRKLFLVFVSFLAATATFGFVFNSCEKEDVGNIDDCDVLSVKSDFVGKAISVDDLDVIGEAMKRMGVAVVNGRIVTNEKSAKQLGISEDLFEQLQLMFAKSNGEKRYGRLRKKVAGEFSDVDCVPKLLSSVLKSFGKDISSDAIKAWCQKEDYYVEGQGVKCNALDTIIHKYLDAKWVPSSAIPLDYKGGGTFLMSVKNNDGSGHFVKVVGTFNSGSNRVYMCENPQDGGNTFYTEKDILSIYSVNGAL